MHSNKKILTSKNSPWLLCPSKSFPGKFYYFNGSTGETAWSLNDTDTKNHKKATICTVTDKTHTYPEPIEPPAEDSNNSSSIRKDAHAEEFPKCTIRNNGFGNILNLRNTFNTGLRTSAEANFSQSNSTATNFTHRNLGHGSLFYENVQNKSSAPSPMFSQAVFPKYVPETSVPKVIWTLTPMLIPEQPTQKRMLDQITQYEPQELLTNVPLTKRFGSFKNPFQFTSTPFCEEVPTFDQMLAQRCKDKRMFDPKPEMKDEGSQTLPKARIRARSLSETRPKRILKSSQSVENLTAIGDENSSSPRNDVDDSSDKLNFLKENDLRFLLDAKRRHSVNLSDNSTPIVNKEPTKQKTPPDDIRTKKRVTFDIDDQDTSTEGVLSNGSLSPVSLEMVCLEPSGAASEDGHVWYISGDASVLLAGFDCVEQYVLSDKNCRLLIPYVVKMKVESLSKGNCIGRQNAVAARQLLRKLATPNAHIVVQQRPEKVGACEEDAILKCCWQLLQESQVVLITDNTKLQDKAKIIDIECHTFDEFKSATKPTATQDPFEWEKVKITVNNDDKPAQNLFQQTLEEFNRGVPQSFDYPARTLFDHQKPDVDRIVFSKTHKGDKLINLTNTKNALKPVCHDVDEIDQDISRLEITEQMVRRNQNRNVFDNDNDDEIRNKKQNQSYQFRNGRENIMISGITKLDNVFDLDEELRRFSIKSDVMENRMKSRRDEWICRLTQIMEEALTDYLLKEKVKYKKILPPWSLDEAILVLGEKLKKQTKIKIVAERFYAHLFNCSNNGKLNQNMKPIDIIKMVGFCMILIQNLKETIDCIEFNEADDRLIELIKNIEDPKTDVEFNLESIITPVLLRSDERETRTPMSYLNKQAEVLEYLKKHFEAMRDYELVKEPKIVRTTGKDLKTLKIGNDKDVFVENVEVKDKVEPKVIRKINVIDAYEEKININIDLLDYEESLITISSENDVLNGEVVFVPSEGTPKSNLSACSAIDKSLHSTLYDECVLACPLLKAFLNELRNTLMQIFSFITDSMQDYQDKELFADKRADIHTKTNMAHKYILKMVDRLQSIIARENRDGPKVKDLLIIAGDYDEEDETMARYKDVVTRYLEQAQILEEALKTLLTLTDRNSELDSVSIKD